jgi:multiple sugar transport system substrate-binding protein
LDTSTSRQVLSYWGGLIRKNIVTTIPEYSVEHWNALRSGRLASAIVPAWALGAYARNLEPAIAKGAIYRLATLPNAGRSSSGNLGGSSLIVAKQTKYPNASVAFAMFAATSAESISQLWNKESRLPAMTSGFDLPDLSSAPTEIFEENPIEIYRTASKAIPEKFEWSPWLPTADAVYRKLFEAALENKISFGQLPALWQQQTLELAWREGFAVR